MSFIGHHKRRIRDIGIGLFAYELFNYAYDFIFYPLVIATLGFVDGGAIAVGTSFIVNSFIFILYEHLRIDWLGAHALRELQDAENQSNITKLMTWMGRKKTTWWEKLLSPVVFVTLTLPIDPLIVAVHHRRQHFKGLTLHDWALLWGATAAANLWWLIKVDIVIEAAKLLISLVH